MTTPEDVALAIRKLSMAYGGQTVINNLSLSMKQGKIGCLIGESGCGKTSVLRTIAGFEPPLSGEIEINGELVSSGNFLLPPAKRSIGMVFQDYALFPHLNVFDNVAFGLRQKKRKQVAKKVMEMLELVKLQTLAKSFPHELSGGQQQRVALARALAMQPRLLLMDEPFSNLDVSLREELSVEVRKILEQAGTTTLFVTHNQQEAFALADTIGVMRQGIICQWDTPYTLYHEPADPFISDFIGEGKRISGHIAGDGIVETGLGPFPLPETLDFVRGQEVSMLIRPEDILHDEGSMLRAKVLQRTFRGAGIMYELELAQGDIVQALVPSSCDHAQGEMLGIRPDVGHVVLFGKSV
jgi:iron(III) transport system ATP-binding protein